MLRLSVLDQSPVRSGGTAADAIHETLELAQACDRCGYHRYWLAEHHSTPGLAGSSPEVLIGQVAARPASIRVGAGGVMLQHYSPLKVAENFRVLETLFPGRIDLGIGRAPGADPLTARALRADARLEDFPQQVADVIAFVGNRVPPDHAFAKVLAMPSGDGAGDVAARLERPERGGRRALRDGVLLCALHQRRWRRRGHARLRAPVSAI